MDRTKLLNLDLKLQQKPWTSVHSRFIHLHRSRYRCCTDTPERRGRTIKSCAKFCRFPPNDRNWGDSFLGSRIILCHKNRASGDGWQKACKDRQQKCDGDRRI